jgi:deazaflavin-dependent oxidoreductase (nitroreductase family)
MPTFFPNALDVTLPAVAERRRQLNWLERRLENFARSKVGGWYFVNVAMRVDRVLLPLTSGRISASPGQPICLLETVGAKSGQLRKTPLLFIPDGERLVLIGSKAGAAKHPGWIHNMRANPRVKILAPRRTGEYLAREAEGEERERLWDKAVDFYAGYETYQGRAGKRRIPVVVLERA